MKERDLLVECIFCTTADKMAKLQQDKEASRLLSVQQKQELKIQLRRVRKWKICQAYQQKNFIN